MSGSRTDAAILRINQTGYATDLPVQAAVSADREVTLKNAAGDVLFSLSAENLPVDAASGDRVRLADFGRLPEGRYVLISGEDIRELTVSAQPWQKVTDALVKGLYFQRCGCALEERHAGKFVHLACHTAPAHEWENPENARVIRGGWHDAGDYGKYVGPGAVAAAHFMYAWRLFPDGCSENLNIPESGNGIPDILNETRYELDWMLQMQCANGAFYHKLTKARFAPFIMPEMDTEMEYVMPVSSCATGAACACLALASRIYRAWDPAFAQNALDAASRAWTWLEANPVCVSFRNPEGVRTGQYGDEHDEDERFWAACELFAATGEDRYRICAEQLFRLGPSLTRFGWASVGGLGALCCLLGMKEKAGNVLYGELKAEFLRQSAEIPELVHASGYGTALAADAYGWGSILPILSNAMAMIMDYVLTGNADMQRDAMLQWHYALGMNALDKCFVTGFGENSVKNPHHRPSGADGIEEPVPGLIAGGPNQRFPYAATREKLGSTRPARYYLDELPSADTNEIAIYWNSPAVFVGCWLNSLCHELQTGKKNQEE